MNRLLRICIGAWLLLTCSTCLAAPEETSSPAESSLQNEQADKPVRLNVGDEAPLFTGIDDKGKKWDAAKVKGKKVLIVYFYPADMTPGCTKQACAYRDVVAKLERKDIEVIGVSGDSVENHQHFRDKYKLNFPLLADPKGKIAKAFGVKTSKGGAFKLELNSKEIEFERGITTKRWTFVIDKQWKLVHVDRNVKAAKDSEKVFKIVEKLP